MQNDYFKQEYARNDVSHAQHDDILVQESWSTRVSKPPDNFDDYVMLSDIAEPSCYNEAISVHNHAKWKQAMQNELDSIYKNGT